MTKNMLRYELCFDFDIIKIKPKRNNGKQLYACWGNDIVEPINKIFNQIEEELKKVEDIKNGNYPLTIGKNTIYLFHWGNR